MTFEEVLKAHQFEPPVEGRDWLQIDGIGTANLVAEDGPLRLTVWLDFGRSERGRTIRWVGSWDDPQEASRELAAKLRTAYLTPVAGSR